MINSKIIKSGRRFITTAIERRRLAAPDISTEVLAKISGDGSGGISKKFRGWILRLMIGLALLAGLFVLYRVVWFYSWSWPYQLICEYMRARLPLASPWLIESFAVMICVLLLAQLGSIARFILLGRNRREMAILVGVGALFHAGLGWYSSDRALVDEMGRICVQVVERPDGTLKVINRNYDPETGRQARVATENDLVMLEFQRTGRKVKRVGKQGPFRSHQGSIIVFYEKRDGCIYLYDGPRHSDVEGDMQLATEEILRQFMRQRCGQ